MTAYYNEHDPRAVAWLRELIRQGHIAPGDVDERSIEDVRPDDLRPYRQCHFFAGIGVWSYALRRAGWPDDRRVWTGSCPCQPFSAAGKGTGFDDERHLWPAWFQLIAQCHPSVVFGEQVASKDGLAWLDLVHTDMESAGYACAPFDLCAAGVGAPHIRQRLYWVGDTAGQRHDGRGHATELEGICAAGGTVGHSLDPGLEGLAGHGDGTAGWSVTARPVAAAGVARGVADADGHSAGVGGVAGSSQGTGVQPGPVANGCGLSCTAWSDAEWLPCRDDRWRPVEPGTFPLAHGAPARMGRLRGYGNAIVAPLAQAFIESYLEK